MLNPFAAPGSSLRLISQSISSATTLLRNLSGLLKTARYGTVPLRKVLPLRALVLLLGALNSPAPAQQINYNSFNGPQAVPSPFSTSCPAGTNVLFCVNYSGSGPSFIQDFYPPLIDPNAATDGGAGSTNYALQLNQNAAGQASSVWYAVPQDVVDGFTTWYTVKINYRGGGDGNTADGLAFVIQNAAGGQTDPISACAESGVGPTVLGSAGGCLGYGGIDNSVALEMDTFFSSWDPQQSSRNTSYSDNHLALQGCGFDGNGNPVANSPAHLTTRNCLISLNGASTLITNPVASFVPTAASSAILLSDGDPHQIVMVYNGPNESPANYLWVYLDATYNPGTHTPVTGSVSLFSGPFDITNYLKLSSGSGGYSPAYVGFTAATGGDFEQHEVMGWTFTPHRNQPNFGNINVCPAGQTSPLPCSQTYTYTYNFPSGASLSATPQVVTQGAPGLDFKLDPTYTTCTGTVAAGSCTVSVTFAPLAPGLRLGAVNLFDTDGTLLASTSIYGVGQGPAALAGPANTESLPQRGFTLAQPRGVAVDAAGNVFIADTGSSRVVKIAIDGTASAVGSGLRYPQGLAIDGAGSLFVADNNLNQVVKIPAGCASTACQTSIGVGLDSQLGVALDGAGDVFISSYNGHKVIEVPVGCTSAACQVVLYNPGTASNPVGIAVDGAGNLFVADYTLAKIVEVPAGCTSVSCQIGVGQNWSHPEGVAVDAAGDIFVADYGLKSVVEVPAGCGTTSCQRSLEYDSFAVAVDAKGAIYIPHFSTGQVVAIGRTQSNVNFAATGVGNTSIDSPQSATLQNIGNQPLIAAGAGLVLNGPDFVQVAGPGALPDCAPGFTYAPGQSCNLSISFQPQSAGSLPLQGTAVFTDNALNAAPASQTVSFLGFGVAPDFPLTLSLLGGGTGTVTDSLQLINCSEVSVGQAGACSAIYSSGSPITLTATVTGTSIFLGWGGACASSGTRPTCSLTIGQATSATASFFDQNFGSYNVCAAGQPIAGPCSNSLPVTFNLPTTTIIGAVQVVTQGATGLDFLQSGGSTCAGTVAGGNACTVNVRFAPIAPGLRLGAVKMFDHNGNLVSSAPIYGFGQEAAIAFGPGAPAALPFSGLGAIPQGTAVDAAGDVYALDSTNNRVLRITPGGTQSMVPTTGLNAPSGIAIDGAGNLFITSTGSGQVVQVTPGGVQTTLNTLGYSLISPVGVAVDGTGNIFVTDIGNSVVVEMLANAGGLSLPVGSGLTRPASIAVDGTGQVFIADSGLGKVFRIANGVQTEVPTGLTGQYSVTVDAAGDLYVLGYQKKKRTLVEVRPSGPASTLLTATPAFTPNAVVVDATGNVYVSGSTATAGQVVKINRSQPPAFTFAATNVGSTSGDSPQALTAENVGNQPLTGSLAFNLGGNFTQNSTTDCSTRFPLAPGVVCGESFSFTPQSATFASGTATFSDNSLNSTPATQTGTLSGVGAISGQAGTVAVPNVVGQPQTAATTPITAAGLVMGTIASASSDTVPSGSIISQNPAAGTQVAIGSTVSVLVSTGIAQPPSPNPLSLENNYFVTGDYVSAGVTLRGTGASGKATGTIKIPSHTQSPSQGVPDGADVIDAFLYWETVESTATASSNSGTFNRYPIVGEQIGNDIPNYADGVSTGTLRAYRASVNVYLPVGANGVRVASGTYTISLPDSGGTALPRTQGASLVMVYRVLSPDFPLKSVVIYDGAALPSVAGRQVVQGFYDAVGGANGTGKSTNLFASAGGWNNSVNTVTLGQANQYSAPLNALSAYAAVIFSTPVSNSDKDAILDAWKAGPPGGDFHAGQPGYYDTKTGAWVGLPGAKHGQKDLFVQLDYMCGTVRADGSCDPAGENLFPAPDSSGNDPLVLVKQAFANSGVQLHLQIGNAVPENTCVDDATTTPATLCQFPDQPGVIGWKNSLEFSKLYPRNLLACLTGGDCTTRFPYGQKDSYHYVLFGHSLAIPAWNTRFGTLTSIKVSQGTATIVTADRGTGINFCPDRFTLSGVLGNPALNGVYKTKSCSDSKTITLNTPGVPDFVYPNTTLPEPVIGLTSGKTSSISGYSDLGGADSAVTLGLWLTAPNQDMSRKANVVAGTLFHEIGHTLGLSHGGTYYDTPGSYVATFEANCKPNYQSVMNYLFQLDLVGPNQSLALSNQTLTTLNESTVGSIQQLTDLSSSAATFPTSAWYVPFTTGSTATPATRHCDGTPLNGDLAYRVDAPIAPVTPAWSNGQDLNFTGTLQTRERGFNDLANMDLRQVGATGGEFASLASVLSFGSSVAPLDISAGGNVTLGSGGTIALGSGGNVTLGSGGNVTLGSGGTITLGSGGNVTLGSGGNVTLGSGGTITPGSSGNVTLGSGGNVTLGSGGTITLGSGGNVTLGSGGNVTLGSGGTITLGSGGTITVPSTGGTYSIDSSGGTITLGSGGNVTLGSGGNVALGSGGTITLGSGGNVTLVSGGNVTLGSGGTITLGSGGNVTLGSGGNVTLGSGGTITLGSGGNVTLGSGGNVTLGSGGTVTLGSGGNVTLGSGGNVTLGSGGSATLGAGGTVTLGSGGSVTLGSGGNVTLGSGGNVTLGSGGTITLGSGGNVTLGSGGTVTLGSGGTITLGGGGAPIVIGAGGSYTFGSSGGTVTLGSGGNVTLGSGGNVTLGSGGTITLGSGGNVTLGSGGTVTLGSGGNVTLGSGGVVTLGTGGSVALGTGSTLGLGSVSNITPVSGGPLTANELNYETANSVVRPPSLPTQTPTSTGVRITWNAPAFGVVQTYTVYRSSDGAAPILIGSVSGVNGFPPATQFIDTNPDRTAQTVVYTISTLLVPDAAGTAPRQSPPSPPAVLKNDQSIALGPLPSSVTLTNPPVVTATALSGGVPNGLQVVFSAIGSCTIGSQTIANNISSALVILTSTGSCTVTGSQPGSNAFNAANAVSGTFMVLPQGSGTRSQTINFAPLQNAQYGGSFSVNATSSAGLPVSFAASGPCTTNGGISGVGVCTITASAPASSTYSAASLTQSFTIYPAVLKVTANNVASMYGQPIPALTYTSSGLVHGDAASVVFGAPALSTAALPTSNAGSYPITVSTGTLAAANYSFLYVSGMLTVNPAGQTITFTTNPPATAAYQGKFTVAAAGGGSGNAVTFTSAGSCSNSGATFTMTNSTGICSVIANQAGSTNYAAAPSVTKSVTATGPLLTVSASGLNFGTVYLGSITAKTLTVTNIGTAAAVITDPFFTIVKGGNSNEFIAISLCPKPLAPGKSCTVLVGFIAGPYYGPQTATLQIMSNAPASPQTVALSANVLHPLASFNPSSLSFPTTRRATSSTLNVTLSNPGGTPLLLSSISVTGTSSSVFAQSSNCGSSVAVGSSCAIAIRFTPPGSGTFSATLTVVDNVSLGGGVQTIPLTGRGN